MRFARNSFLEPTASLIVLSILFASSWSHTTFSQTPKAIKIVTPVPPSGSLDILARLVTDQIGRASRGPIITTENRPGGGGVIGTEVVARAAPDGSTLLMAATSILISPYLQKVNYDPLTTFEPICELADVPTVIVVNAASPYGPLLI